MKARDALREVGSASRPVHSSALKKWRAGHAAHIMRRQMGSVSCACVFVILVMLATNLPPSLVEAIPDQRLSASHCMRRSPTCHPCKPDPGPCFLGWLLQ
mmetsp:Transcript_54556/g.110908  ORF Transcript_54556/g.110908 Transcript_54556/m.110908 type:complete len:100 (-) Transcript_54556:16-315(-)